MLFLIVLGKYEHWTGDSALARELEPTARPARSGAPSPCEELPREERFDVGT